MINKTVLVGRITKDPEIKHTQSDIMFCRFTLAVNRTYKNRDGGQEVDFISCIAWRKQAENMGRFVDKGNLLGIDGRIETGSYDKDGVKVYTTTIVCDSVIFLEPKAQKEQAQTTQFTPPELGNKKEPRIGYDVNEDEMPF